MLKKLRRAKRRKRRQAGTDVEARQPHHRDYPKPRVEAEVFEELTALCTSPGYIHALSYLIFRDSVVTAGEEFKKEDFQKLYSRERLIRTEIVTLVGLWLKGERSLAIQDASTTQYYADRTDQLLAELHAAMLAPAQRDFIGAIEAHNSYKAAESPLGKAAAMREAVFYSGESAFTFQYSDFARERYSADAEWLKAKYGFDIDAAASFFEPLIAYLSEQIPLRLRAMRQLPMSQWTMLPVYCFTEEEAVTATGLDEEVVRNILKAFTVRPESKNERYAHPFAFNEAAITPFVRLDDSRYAFLQEYVGTESLYNSPSYWMRGDANYKATASKHRGDFAETLSLKLIERVFPPDRIFRNVLFKSSKGVTGAEADLVLIHGKRAFVFQLKSKGLTEQARAGDELAISRDFSAAVQHAYDQAVSCIKHLKAGTPTYTNGQLFTLPDVDAVEEFYPVCLTSENYPALSFQVGQFLRRSDKVGLQDPLIMDLFTLDVITEFLRSPLYFIDYLSKRSRLFEKVLASHEMVLFSYHLRRNLFVPDGVSMLYVEDDFMVELDLAMAVRRRGLPGSVTPEGILTRDLDNPLGRILVGADQTKRPEVHQLGELILNLGSDAWDNINRWVRRLCLEARRDHKDHDVTLPLGDGGLTIHCSKQDQTKAMTKLASHCEIRKYVHKADQWFGACFDPETEQVRFALGRVGVWKFEPQLEEESQALKVRSANHFVDASGLRSKLGRNDPCPCGSGKKYKKCHLN